MKKFLFLLLALAAVFTVSAADIVVAIPEKSCDVEVVAARELAQYLKKSTGNNVTLARENQLAAPAQYYVGKTARAAGLGILPPAERDSFTIKFSDNALFIVGVDGNGKERNFTNPAGTLFGVYHFLRKSLGIRWIYPGKHGEFVPRKQGFVPSAKDDAVFIPKLKDRFTGSNKYPKEVYRHYRRNMFLSRAMIGTGGHNTQIYKKFGKTNPEFFSYISREKKRINFAHGTFCLSNEQLQQEIVKMAIEAKRPFVSGHEADNVRRCECPNCSAWDGSDVRGPTGRYAIYKNYGERYGRWYLELLKKAKAVDPSLKVSAYAYQSYIYAPRNIKLHKDIYIGLVPDIPFPRRPEYNEFLRREYRAWRDTGATLYLRPNNYNGGYCMPEVWFDEYVDEVKYLLDLGLRGIAMDGGVPKMYAARGLDLYFMMRIAAEPELDAKVIFEEYLDCFGAAKEDMRAYFLSLQKYLKDNCSKINDIYEASQRGWYFHGYDYAIYAYKIFPARVLKGYLAMLDGAIKKCPAGSPEMKYIKFIRSGIQHAYKVSECTRLFASIAPQEKKASAWNRLNSERAKLPAYAVDADFALRIERRHWKLATPPQQAGAFQMFPEYCRAQTDPENKGESLKYFDPKFDDSKWRVLSTWMSVETQGYKDFNHIFYRMRINVAEKDNRRCILRLGAVDKQCKVWVNGKFAGKTKFDVVKNPDSWKEAVEMDITDLVIYGKENLICVKVDCLNGPHTGIWKPSFLRLERAAVSTIPLKFGKNRFGTNEKGVITIATPDGVDAKTAKFMAVTANINPAKLQGKTVRVRGQVQITEKQKGGRADVSLRQHDENKKIIDFQQVVFKGSNGHWEDFSLEATVKPEAKKLACLVIGRHLPRNISAQFRNITLEILE